MHVLQDGSVREFPSRLTPLVMGAISRQTEIIRGVSFDPHGNVILSIPDGVIVAGTHEVEPAFAGFPEPADTLRAELDRWVVVDEFEDPWESIAARLEIPIQQLTWDELVAAGRRPHKSWKWRRDARYHAVDMFW
jgi:hypothetical protein